ncbi:MAG: DegV family protein [Ilumatobacteraceae bacterium]
MSMPVGPIGLCTDSNSQLPPELAERFGVEIVPLTVIVDDQEYLEGIDLDPDSFYALYADGAAPATRWVEPSAGQFAAAYEDLAAKGCSQILSIHTSLASCSIVRAARLAAHNSPVPVRLIDSGTARFGVGCCVWAAGDAIAAGATIDQAATIAESLAPAIGNVFIVSGLDLVPDMLGTAMRSDHSRAVLTIEAGQIEVLTRIETMVDAVNSMASYVLDWGDRLNVAIGVAHNDAWPMAEALGHAIGEAASVNEVVHYRISPSVGVETGPGTVGCVVYPA